MKAFQKTVKPASDAWPPLSILICAKNEAKNLQSFLPAVLEQDYPKNKLQVIVVNDRSTDESSDILNQFLLHHPQLRVIKISEEEIQELPGKKNALKIGVSHCDSDYILLSDADCMPSSDMWAKYMVSAAQAVQADVLLGMGKYKYLRADLLNMFIQFETLHTAIQYASYSIFQAGYMGVGRNLLYRAEVIKKAFCDPALLSRMKQTNSGDDDLIVSYTAQKGYRLIPFFHKKAQTLSVPAASLSQYFTQKSRHTSSSKFYPLRSKLLLGLYALSHTGFWAGSLYAVLVFLFAIDYSVTEKLLFTSLLITLFLKIINYHLWVSVSAYRYSGIIYLLAEPVWAIYNVILSPYIFWKNTFKWK